MDLWPFYFQQKSCVTEIFLLTEKENFIGKRLKKTKTTTTKTPALPLTKIKQDLPGSIQEKCHSEIDIVKWDSTGHPV